MKRPSTSSSAGSGGSFNLLPLPPAPPPSHSKLRRSSSLAVDPAGAPSPDSATHLPSPQPQGLPLLRTVSEPIPFLSHCSPPDPNPNHMLSAGPRIGSRSPASGSESPASKRLKRMSERMKEMKQWFDQLIQQSDQDCDSETDDDEAEDIHGNKNVESEGGYEEQENTVSADQQGDAINIRFKCPCGDSYHILLLGRDYYYKLL